MALTGSNIAARVARLMSDITNAAFTTTEVLLWINEAQREIALVRPDASISVGNTELTAVTSVQTLTISGVTPLRLISIIRNMGTGAQIGKAVSYLPRDVLDNNNRSWHNSTPGTSVDHYCYDDAAETKFLIYPLVQSAGGPYYLEAAVSVAPAELAAIGDALTIPDIFESLILDWCMYRCLSKQSAKLSNPSIGQAFLQAFKKSLGVKSGAEQAASLNLVRFPSNPNQRQLSTLQESRR